MTDPTPNWRHGQAGKSAYVPPVRGLAVAVAVAVTAAALLLGACSGGSSKKADTAKSAGTTAPIELPPPRDKPPAGGDSTTTSTDGGGATSAPTTAAPAGDHGPEQFQSPSGNIGCFVDASSARCDIRQRAWTPTPKPPECDLDYGQGITVNGDHADFVCAGDTTLGQGPPLPFGSSSQRDTFICESATAGVTCHETRHGHGFFISRESYRIF